MQGPSLVRGFAPGGIGPRDIASRSTSRRSALGGTTYYGASAEVDFPIFGLPKEIGLKGAVFADAGNLLGYSGQTELLEFPWLHLLSAAGHRQRFLITQPSCAKVWDPNLIRTSVGASLIWALADGADPLRLRAPAYEGQVRPDPDLQLLGRRDLLSRRRLSQQAGAPETGAPVVASDGTSSLAKIRFFPPISAPSLAEVASWCGAALASEADAGRVITRCRRARPGGPGRSDLPRQSPISRRPPVDARRRRAGRASAMPALRPPAAPCS